MTKPGNSDPEETSQPAEAPTEAKPTPEPGPAPDAASASSAANATTGAKTEPSADAESAKAEPATAASEESESAKADPTAEAEPSATGGKAEPAAKGESAGDAEPSAAGGKVEPAADAESAADAEPGTASVSGAGADGEAEPAAAEDKSAEAEAKPAAKTTPAKARRVRPVDSEPLMTDLEKAPPSPRNEALRAQAKRRFEEPPPRTLRFSFYFFVGSGLIWIVNAIQYLVFKQDIIDAQADLAPELRATPDQINNSIWAMVVLAVTFTAFLGLFGYKATAGTRRARTLVTIFSSMLVIFHLLLNGSPLGLLSALLSLTALALLWSKSARSYFPPRQVP